PLSRTVGIAVDPIQPPRRVTAKVLSLTGQAVDHLPDQVEVTGVPGGLLDHVREHPANVVPAAAAGPDHHVVEVMLGEVAPAEIQQAVELYTFATHLGGPRSVVGFRHASQCVGLTDARVNRYPDTVGKSAVVTS